MHYTRVKPHIHNVGDFFILLCFRTQQFNWIEFKPRINALLFNQSGDRFNQLS